MTKTFRFGVIGCGLMGREFASAAARWLHLADVKARPEIVAVCDTNTTLLDWFRDHGAAGPPGGGERDHFDHAAAIKTPNGSAPGGDARLRPGLF